MSELNREQAWNLLTEYNQDQFHLYHAKVVEGIMKWKRFCSQPMNFRA